MKKIFIDGSAGTTGLRIHQRLAERKDLEIFTLSEALRKDPEARKDALNRADLAFLCLPDPAAVEAVGMIENDHTVVIDTSTAHRTAPGWVYGFPELLDSSEEIARAKRIANPGCHASGFVSLVAPLVKSGLLRPSARLSVVSVTGYSGGGKSMIAQYEDENRSPLLDAPRFYGLGQEHKHLKEMVYVCGLEKAPLFSPIVCPFYSGMETAVTLTAEDLTAPIKEISDCYRARYEKGLVRFSEKADEEGFLSAAAYSNRDDMQICITGNEERIVLISRFDNLGKGASGAAIQNMNIVLGCDEAAGLIV